MISMDKKYRTRDGRAVRILAVDRKTVGMYPVVGLIDFKRDEEIGSWCSNGRSVANGISNLDLVEVEQIEIKGYVNVYSEEFGSVFKTRQEAEIYSATDVLDIIEITHTITRTKEIE